MNSVYADGYKELELVPLCLYIETHELLMVLWLTKDKFNAQFFATMMFPTMQHDSLFDAACLKKKFRVLELGFFWNEKYNDDSNKKDFKYFLLSQIELSLFLFVTYNAISTEQKKNDRKVMIRTRRVESSDCSIVSKHFSWNVLDFYTRRKFLRSEEV